MVDIGEYIQEHMGLFLIKSILATILAMIIMGILGVLVMTSGELAPISANAIAIAIGLGVGLILSTIAAFFVVDEEKLKKGIMIDGLVGCSLLGIPIVLADSYVTALTALVAFMFDTFSVLGYVFLMVMIIVFVIVVYLALTYINLFGKER
jgi:hypothetical protein